MCLTRPATVLEVRPAGLVVELDGRRQIVSSLLVPEARVGDEVLVGLGRALNVLTREEAEQLRDILAPLTSPTADPA
jgi:hydrogenase expression/formation protein HypC